MSARRTKRGVELEQLVLFKKRGSKQRGTGRSPKSKRVQIGSHPE